jgi:hypothetical protein
VPTLPERPVDRLDWSSLMDRHARPRVHAIRPIRGDPSNPSIRAVSADWHCRLAIAPTWARSNVVVQIRAFDPITAGTPDGHGDQEPHSSNAHVAHPLRQGRPRTPSLLAGAVSRRSGAHGIVKRLVRLSVHGCLAEAWGQVASGVAHRLTPTPAWPNRCSHYGCVG